MPLVEHRRLEAGLDDAAVTGLVVFVLGRHGNLSAMPCVQTRSVPQLLNSPEDDAVYDAGAFLVEAEAQRVAGHHWERQCPQMMEEIEGSILRGAVTLDELRAYEATALLAIGQRSQSPQVQEVIANVLGDAMAPEGRLWLERLVDNPDAGVRAAAVDALGKIGDSRSGAVLMHRWHAEGDNSVRQMLAAAFGPCRAPGAVEVLIEAVRSSDRVLRGTAAWALGFFADDGRVRAVVEAALAQETNDYNRQQLVDALTRAGKG